MNQPCSKNAARLNNLHQGQTDQQNEPLQVNIISTHSMKILRLPAVKEKVGIARSTIYDWINPKSSRYDPTFPRAIPLGKKSVGWLESELEQWLLLRKSH